MRAPSSSIGLSRSLSLPPPCSLSEFFQVRLPPLLQPHTAAHSGSCFHRVAVCSVSFSAAPLSFSGTPSCNFICGVAGSWRLAEWPMRSLRTERSTLCLKPEVHGCPLLSAIPSLYRSWLVAGRHQRHCIRNCHHHYHRR